MNIKLIALGSTKMVGKDTFFAILKTYNKNFTRFAFADLLKDYTDPLCVSIFNKHIYELSPDEKEVFRPILIETGKVCRNIDIDYWVKRTNREIEKLTSINPDIIPVITDLRFENEYKYLKSIYGESMLYVDIEREGAPEPTEEEKLHAPKLKVLADRKIFWKTDPTFVSLRPIVRNFYDNSFPKL